MLFFFYSRSLRDIFTHPHGILIFIYTKEAYASNSFEKLDIIFFKFILKFIEDKNYDEK